MVICSIAMILAWISVKSTLSCTTRYHEKLDYEHVLSLLSNIITSGVTAIIVSFHYTFFIAVLLNRFCILVENFEWVIDSTNDDDLIKALDGFIYYYSTFESLIERINMIFCLQVIDQWIFSMNFIYFLIHLQLRQCLHWLWRYRRVWYSSFH